MHEAVDPVQARESRLEQIRTWGSRTTVLTTALAGFVLILFALRLWLTRKIATPWIMSDELLYSELARSFADSGHFLVRGEFYPIYNVGYPLFISPAWLAGSMETRSAAMSSRVGMGVTLRRNLPTSSRRSGYPKILLASVFQRAYSSPRRVATIYPF